MSRFIVKPIVAGEGEEAKGVEVVESGVVDSKIMFPTLITMSPLQHSTINKLYKIKTIVEIFTTIGCVFFYPGVFVLH